MKTSKQAFKALKNGKKVKFFVKSLKENYSIIRAIEFDPSYNGTKYDFSYQIANFKFQNSPCILTKFEVIDI
jgi:hypothetical protein